MSLPGTIVAIGGGGFTHRSDPELDGFVLSLAAMDFPKFGYIGAANDDNPHRVSSFYQRFGETPCGLSHLERSASAGEAHRWIAAQDIIYVAGGNTAALMVQLTEWEARPAFARAAASGTILAGVSAGAVCWFEYALSDSAGAGLEPLAGLGLVAGSCCPHYSSQPDRPPAFEQQIGEGRLPPGIAIDDGAALALRDGTPVALCSARSGADAYRVESGPPGARTSPLRTGLNARKT